MSSVYDSWEKLVGAVFKRDELRRLALCDSFSSSGSTNFSMRCSIDFSDNASFEQNNLSHHVVRPIELEEIIKATENFRPDLFLGAGALCQAFKAWIDEHTLTATKPGSGRAVVVKIWHRNNPKRHQDWLKEISYLLNIRHPDLVDLVGYCTEEDNMILVYEFMPEGSLENHLFTKRYYSLPWATRIKVALDAARGLSYLHGQEIPIIHRDFRSANILLDGEFNAKLSNYCYGTDDPTGDMACISTHQVFDARGYAAPDAKDHLSTKSNVYSFGAVLLELLSGTPATNLSWAEPYFSKKRKLVQIMDIRLDGQYSHDAAYKIAKLALKCLSIDPKLRPNMADVVVALQHLYHS
ncbi:protein kinase 2B [Perilla frutescens var. hirtella]|nr:protein kinase 2B [Perilla frutescens var. hirtella]